jgi:two-component system LytT family sensor kinase
LSWKKNLYHIFFWFTYSCCCIGISKLQSPRSFVFVDQVTKYTLAISIFYFTLYFLTTFKKINLYIQIFILPIPFIWYYLMKYLLYYRFFPAYIDFPKVAFKWDQFILTGVWWIFHFAMYGFFYWYYFKTINNKKVVFELKTKNLNLENEKIKLEYDFLKAQINPHFLHNCLNFLYSETFEKNPNVSEAILMLSDIMRYSLKDYSDTNGLANLSEEIEHIENVININQLRFVDSLHIDIKIEGEPEGKLVVPMVLMTLVENVFKHGDLHDKNHPALIHCKIDSSREMLYFSTYNKKKMGTKEPSTGIGLNNIKQRLQSLYQDNFSITTIEDESNYKKEINIPYLDYSYPKNASIKTPNYTV